MTVKDKKFTKLSNETYEMEDKLYAINSKPYSDLKSQYYMVPNWLHFTLTKIGVSPQEKLVYECMLRYANNSNRNPFPSYSRIMEFTGIKSRTTVIKCIQRLIDLGLIIQVRKGGYNLKGGNTSNEYKVYYIYELPQR